MKNSQRVVPEQLSYCALKYSFLYQLIIKHHSTRILKIKKKKSVS